MSDDVYRPSGRVAWVRLLLFAVLSLPILLLLSDLAFRLDRARWFQVIGPILVVALAGVMGTMVVEWGKCRSVVVGRVVVIAAVLVFYFGFYQRSLIDARMRGSSEGLKGVPIGELFSGLPDYIFYRMRNIEKAKGLARPEDEHNLILFVGLNWTVFALHLIALTGLGWFLGGTIAKRPFSERENRWMTSRRFAMPSGSAEAIVEWLDGRGPLPPDTDNPIADVVLLEHIPKSEREDAFVTLAAYALVRGEVPRQLLTHRRRVPAERLEELRAFLA